MHWEHHITISIILIQITIISTGPGGEAEEPRARRRAGVQRRSERGDACGEDFGGRDSCGAED